jgi:hypothetical protein
MKVLKFIFIQMPLITVIYCLFVLDRVITSVFPTEQLSFQQWLELDLDEKFRDFKEPVKSLIRVGSVVILIILVNLFI